MHEHEAPMFAMEREVGGAGGRESTPSLWSAAENGGEWMREHESSTERREGKKRRKTSCRESEALIASLSLPSFPTRLFLVCIHLHSPRRRTSVEGRCDSKWSGVIKPRERRACWHARCCLLLWRRVANVTSKKRRRGVIHPRASAAAARQHKRTSGGPFVTMIQGRAACVVKGRY